MIEFSSITFITSLKTFTKHRVAILKFSDCTVIIPSCKVIIGRYDTMQSSSNQSMHISTISQAIILMYEYLDKISNSPNYKRINGTLPNYLNEHLILNNKRHSRNTKYSSTNAVCPKYKRETEGGRSFAVSATRLWNSTPIEIRKLNSVACFKKNMFAKIFKEQQFLHHFII